MRLSLIAAASLFFANALAVFSDEAWSLDYHYALLGEPQDETTFFHPPNPSSPAALLYTLSSRGVLGAVNPRDGAVVWRQWLPASGLRPNATFLRAGDGQDTVIGGYDEKVAAWSAMDGRQAWEVALSGELKDVEVLEIPDGKQTPGAKDVVVLSQGETPLVQRIDGASGSVKWQHKLDGGDIAYQISASNTELYAVLLHKTMLGYIKIKVVSLDPVDGRRTDEYTLSSESELSSPDTIISVGANSASPIIAWTDASYTTLKINLVGTKSIQSFNIEKHDDLAVDSVKIHAPYRINSVAHFLVHYETESSHWADVFHVDIKKSKIEKAYNLPKLTGRGAFATSTSNANVYFTRISSDEIMTVSSASHGVLGRWPIANFGITTAPGERPFPMSATSELSIKGDSVSAIRSAVLLSTGDWVLLRDGSPVWQRPESLATTLTATFATPAKVENLAEELEIEAQSNIVQAYIRRVTRHIGQLQQLPAQLSALPQRVMHAFLGTSADGTLDSDAFGFHKIIVCATGNGRIVALDAGSPEKILWSRQIVLLKAGEIWSPTIDSHDSSILQVSRGPNLPLLLLNATNGELVGASPSAQPAHRADPHAIEYTMQDGELRASKSAGDGGDSLNMWHFTPSAGDRIVGLVPRPVNDPVASIGKVLGDRRVLYKYLDPNLALLTTANDALKTASFYVLNTISGAVLHASSHSNVDLRAPISSTVSENWFAYSFTAESSDTTTKGHQLVVGELFESLAPNTRASHSESANFSSLETGIEPFTLTRSYQIPEAISKMAVTQTRQGITSRQLLAVLSDSLSIVGIPYGALDPRRPVNRDPTKDEQAEGLVRYAPVIDFDPQWYLNHQRELLGISEIVTTPALLESTSIVFAYGLDVFGTRLSPSFSFDILGKGFNKFQMLATVAGLAVATFVVAPLVMRKQVNIRWQFT